MTTELGRLVAKRYTAKLPDDKLKERICNFLKGQTMCTLATSLGDTPRATLLEYYSEGTTLYIGADPGTKIKNIQANEKVCIAIYNMVHPDWSGDDWKSIKAARITGEAMVLEPDDPESIRARKEIIQWQLFAKALGLDENEPPKGSRVIKVEAKEIDYYEFALMLEGYIARQVWQAST
jgi:nitroimidazol reductase NimA-like FMN-containing flavoprotein (pyridoxamine 5'-phosphate oxidase superfamily)